MKKDRQKITDKKPHTPLPWKIEKLGRSSLTIVTASNKDGIQYLPVIEPRQLEPILPCNQDLEFIVEAVNARYTLEEIIKEIEELKLKRALEIRSNKAIDAKTGYTMSVNFYEGADQAISIIRKHINQTKGNENEH